MGRYSGRKTAAKTARDPRAAANGWDRRVCIDDKLGPPRERHGATLALWHAVPAPRESISASSQNPGRSPARGDTRRSLRDVQSGNTPDTWGRHSQHESPGPLVTGVVPETRHR